MIKRICHFFFGHNWSDWRTEIYSPGAYDCEIWQEKYCDCGATQQRDI